MKLKCKKCDAENDSTLAYDPYTFKPYSAFICWFCKEKNVIDLELEQDKSAIS